MSDDVLAYHDDSVQTLDPLTLPLTGQGLIEASAGTGKTYTLAALYLRLILGLGRDNPLEVEQILVVTFTQAATQELRERIRERIQKARIAFVTGQSQDPFLQQLMLQHKDHERAILDLEFAASEMDQAAIFTIHGFCQRMLMQHAFESGANFNAQLINDDSDVVRRALLDFWRCQLYSADTSLAREILANYKTPDDLLKKIRSYLSLENIVLIPDYSNYPLVERWQQFEQAEKELRISVAAVRESKDPADDLMAIIQSSSVNKRSYSKRNLPNWLLKLDAFAQGEKVALDSLLKFSQAVLIEKSGADAPQHGIFEKIESFCAAHIDVKAVVFCRALSAVRTNMAIEKEQHQQLSFDDLLNTLARVLNSDNAEALSSAIRQQYPFALIDEFQDTDPQQYDIFCKLYHLGAQGSEAEVEQGSCQLNQPLMSDSIIANANTNERKTFAAQREKLGFLMIGDPKQSIYAFRGADIFTYMKARQQVTQRYTLAKNWRSSASMVSATNTLFSRSPAPFIYQQDISFYSVEAANQDEPQLALQGNSINALSFWYSDKAVNTEQYLTQTALTCATQIAKMLSTGTLKNKPVNPANIAVLVRDRKEAGLVQQALMQLKIDSVFMSNRENVYLTTIAREMYYILQAVNDPNNERLLRTALATEIFQLNSHELFALNQDELAWEALVDECLNYRKIWERSGVLAMLHALLQQRALAQRWLAYADGERRLTDYLHLAELLEQACVDLDSKEALIRYFQEKRAQSSNQAQELQLRLDSDRQRVTVITIHKSKGLEYDIVYLPFVCRYRQASNLLYHDALGQPTLNFDDDNKEEASKEQLAEDLRLLYVAITRAVHACFIGMADVTLRNKSVWQKTAIGYLLTLIKKDEESCLLEGVTLAECLALLAKDDANISLISLDNIVLEQSDMFVDDVKDATQTITASEQVLSAREFNRLINRDWRVTSYSALSRDAQHLTVQDPRAENKLTSDTLDIEVIEEQAIEAEISDQKTIFNFHKGAVAGTFLHGIYEEIDFEQCQKQDIATVLEKRLPLVGYELSWLPCLTEFVDQSLDAQLTATPFIEGFTLRDISAANRLVEMEFVFPFAAINCQQVNQLLVKHDALAAQAGLLMFEQVEGMLKGFIDLTIRHDNKYYVVDYKSNFLGSALEDYHLSAIEQAMIEHRYDFQYVLYTLALHRLLRSRLENYDYDTHVGGVFYLFLRGLQAQSQTGVFYTKPKKALIEQLDALFENIK
jgi:exodeoxyribonuclease V beta subunit